MSLAQPAEMPFHETGWVPWAMVLTDALSLLGALLMAFIAWCASGYICSADQLIDTYVSLIVCVSFLPVGYCVAGLYPGYGITSVERLRRQALVTFLFCLSYLAWHVFTTDADRPTLFLLPAFAFILSIPPGIQALLRQALVRKGYWGSSVVLLGPMRLMKELAETLVKTPTIGLHPVAIFDCHRQQGGERFTPASCIPGIDKYAGKVHYLLAVLPCKESELAGEFTGETAFRHTLILTDAESMPDLAAAVRIMEGVIGLEHRSRLSLRRSFLFKRFLDYAGGLLLFILSAPVLLFFALFIMSISPGNPFYSQVREGRGGKRFKVWKLRTMYPGAERLLADYLKDNPEARKEWHTYFKLRDDPRVLKGIGTLLRRTSLDELPQLWNVLRGEMSLIGPRPFPHYHLEQFSKEFRELRRGVIPGMTGLWQVVARSDGNLAVQERLDTCYIRHWSIWLDISILVRTVLIVFSAKGAY